MSVKRAFFSVFQKIMVFCCAIFFGFADAFSANLPSGYTELEYIESTGTQYIDTGYKPKTGDKIRIVYQYNSLYGGDDGRDATSIFGCTDGASAANAFNGVARVVQGTDTINRIAWGNGTNSIIGNLTYNNATGVWYDLVCDNGVFTINDTQLGTTSANSFSANFSMYLFARNTGGTAGLITKGKIQIAQIWDNGTLVRNMVPAKNSSGVVGMYDTVNDVFYTNSGTGTFTAGPVVVTNSGPISSVTVAGLVAQNGTPTPNAPVDIVSNNGVLKVSRNLFKVSTWTHGEYLVQDGTRSPSSVWGYSDYIPVQQNTTYYLSGFTSSLGVSAYHCFYDNNKNFVSSVLAQASKAYQINIPSGVAFIRITGRDGGNASTTYANAQFEQGSTATPYMPYGQIYTDGEVETIADSANHTATVATLLGVGDYRDTQNINTGAITRNVGVKVLDGTENWAYNTMISYHFTYKLPNQKDDTSAFYQTYCSHFVSTNTTDNNTCKLQYKTFSIRYDNANGDTTSFKQYLAEQYANGTPVMIVYPLATETTESVAGQTMTTAPVNNRTGGVAGMTITTLLSSGTSVVTTIATNAIKIATTAYNTARFSPVQTELNNTIATIREIVTKTINQTAAIASLQADKQTRPEEQCPAGKKCLLVETEENGVIVPHWFPIIESPE